MTQRRTVLRAMASSVSCLGLAGCISAEDGEPPATSEGRSDARTETPTGTPTESTTPTTTVVPPETATEQPDLELKNHTDAEHALPLKVDPDDGETVTDSWTLDPTSTTKVTTYPLLGGAAQVTASVEGYNTATHNWTGSERGKLLAVVITDEEIEFRTVMN